MSNGTAPNEDPTHHEVGASGASPSSPPVSTAPTAPADLLERVTKQRVALAERYQQPEIRVASYEGNCPSCHRRIKVGDEIAGLNGWVHLVCAVCAVCGTWVDADAVDAPGGIGKVHGGCQLAAAN